MRKVYKLIELENDDYFRGHNEFVCKIIEIEEEVTCRDFYQEGDKLIRNNTTIRYRIKGEKYLQDIDKRTLFKTIGGVIDYIKKKYKLVHEDDNYYYLLELSRCNHTVAMSNYRNRGIANGYVKLSEEYFKEEL